MKLVFFCALCALFVQPGDAGLTELLESLSDLGCKVTSSFGDKCGLQMDYCDGQAHTFSKDVFDAMMNLRKRTRIAKDDGYLIKKNPLTQQLTGDDQYACRNTGKGIGAAWDAFTASIATDYYESGGSYPTPQEVLEAGSLNPYLDAFYFAFTEAEIDLMTAFKAAATEFFPSCNGPAHKADALQHSGFSAFLSWQLAGKHGKDTAMNKALNFMNVREDCHAPSETTGAQAYQSMTELERMNFLMDKNNNEVGAKKLRDMVKTLCVGWGLHCWEDRPSKKKLFEAIKDKIDDGIAFDNLQDMEDASFTNKIWYLNPLTVWTDDGSFVSSGECETCPDYVPPFEFDEDFTEEWNGAGKCVPWDTCENNVDCCPHEAVDNNMWHTYLDPEETSPELISSHIDFLASQPSLVFDAGEGCVPFLPSEDSMASYQNDLINAHSEIEEESANRRKLLVEGSGGGDGYYKCFDGEYYYYSSNPCPPGSGAEMTEEDPNIYMCETPEADRWFQAEECSENEEAAENSQQYRCFNGDYYYYSSFPCKDGHEAEKSTVDAEPTCYTDVGLALPNKPALYEENVIDVLEDDDEGNVPFVRDFDPTSDAEFLIDHGLWCPQKEISSEKSSSKGRTMLVQNYKCFNGDYYYYSSFPCKDGHEAPRSSELENPVQKCYDDENNTVEYKKSCSRGQTLLPMSDMTKDESEDFKGRMSSSQKSQLDAFCAEHSEEVKTINKNSNRAGSVGGLSGGIITTIAIVSCALVGMVVITVKNKMTDKNQNTKD